MKLLDARLSKGRTQEDLARAADISLAHYQKIEKGKSIPGVDIAILICDELEVEDPRDIDEFVNPRPRKKPGPKSK